jgi:hypothetical protein
VLNYNHGSLEEKCFQIAGYALQADFGNYQSSVVQDNYFDPREYFPAWVSHVKLLNPNNTKYRKWTFPLFNVDKSFHHLRENCKKSSDCRHSGERCASQILSALI